MFIPSDQIFEYTYLLISILVLILMGAAGFLLIKSALKKIMRKQFITNTTYVISKRIIRWFIIVIIALLIFQQFGIHVTSIWATLLTIAGMVAVGFIAVWSILSNILSSILIMAIQPFQIGDEIEIMDISSTKGLKGKVLTFNMMYTVLEEKKGKNRKSIIQIPNNAFFQRSIRVYQDLKK